MSAALSSWRTSYFFRQSRLRRSRKAILVADQRGAVSFEMLFVYPFLVLGLLLPLVDVALAGFQYISAWQALRAFGQSILYTPPPDVTNLSAGNWASTVQTKAAFNSRFPIGNLQVECGSSPCSADTATVVPKYYSYSTTVTLAPTVLKSVLCTSGTGDGCTFTLFYSERFQ